MQLEQKNVKINYKLFPKPNQESSFGILSCIDVETNEILTIKGDGLGGFEKDKQLTVSGYWDNNAKFGKQFVVREFEELLPMDTNEIVAYIASELRGIGPKTAEKIVAMFGTETYNIIESNPDELTKVSGISSNKVNSIVESWNEKRADRRLMQFLIPLGVSSRICMKLKEAYGSADKALEIVKKHPYVLANDSDEDGVEGIGFKKATEIATKLGVPANDPERLECGIVYALKKKAQEGNCYEDEEELLDYASSYDILGINGEPVSMAYQRLCNSKIIIKDDECSYLKKYFNSESRVATDMKRVVECKSTSKVDTESILLSTQAEVNIQYDDIQLDAIRTALDNKVVILTGGPGTGKTTTVNGMIHAFEGLDYKVLCAAPTGRAAKRMSEATKHEAKTIHRLLGYNPATGYKKNSKEPLEGDVLILDEASMIDIELFARLLAAVPSDMKVVIVGDTDQLPSVGAGNVLRDLIDSHLIPVVKLNKVHRQAQRSMIIRNAYHVNNGEKIEYVPGIDSDNDFEFTKTEFKEEIVPTIVDYCKDIIPNKYGFDGLKDIQVLAPLRKGDVGTHNLNVVLQEALNPKCNLIENTDIYKYGNTEFRLHDKVMQIKNNYDKDIYNGDVGYIVGVDNENKIISVQFDGGTRIDYESNELDELVLSYATTIHKSQGSEYPVVIIPVCSENSYFMERSILYTGMTRARKLLIFVGEPKTVVVATNKVRSRFRKTKLKQRLQAQMNRADTDVISDEVIQNIFGEDVEKMNNKEEKEIETVLLQDSPILDLYCQLPSF